MPKAKSTDKLHRDKKEGRHWSKTMKFKTKAQWMWEVSKEHEEEFRKGIPEIVNDIETWELFKMIRGAEYRRGKEDGNKEAIEEFKNRIDKRIVKLNEHRKDVPNKLENKKRREPAIKETRLICGKCKTEQKMTKRFHGKGTFSWWCPNCEDQISESAVLSPKGKTK